jgi:hypothetical protein
MISDEVWRFVEDVERENGDPILFQRVLSETRSGLTSKGNHFWDTPRGRSWLETVNWQVELQRPGQWNRIFRPRSIADAITVAHVALHEDDEARLKSIPIVVSTSPAFGAAACERDSREIVLINLALVVGLEITNVLMTDLFSALRVGRPSRFLRRRWDLRTELALRKLRHGREQVVKWLAAPESSGPIPFDLSSLGKSSGAFMVHVQLAFVILHELAHFFGEPGPDDPLAEWADMPGIANRATANELRADLMALSWLMGTHKLAREVEEFDQVGVENGWGRAVVNLFAALQFLEEARAGLGQENSSTHPSPLMRLAYLEVMTQDEFPTFSRHLSGASGLIRQLY